jgi:hypothetical protein
VPDVDAVIVAFSVESERAHPVAVPPDAIAYVIAPVPSDPDVLMESDCEYGKVLLEVPRLLNVII